MLNYSVHALESFREVMSMPGIRGKEGCVRTLKEVALLLQSAVKFALPENGQVVDYGKAIDLLEPEIVRMPFPVCALEYHVSDFSKMQADECAVEKRIALCLDCPKGSAPDSPYFSWLMQQADSEFARLGGVLVIPIYFVESLWMPNAFGAALLRKTRDAGSEVTPPKGWEKAKTSTVAVSTFPLMFELAATIVDQCGMRKALEDAHKDTNDEMLAVAGLMVALSCSNVSLAGTPPPLKLNQKRLKSGKIPFDGYKEIVINTKPHLVGQSREKVNGRTMPEHLRRGHIRRYESKKIWINSLVVNAGSGAVPKAYQVR